jgi:hypothetical protein
MNLGQTHREWKPSAGSDKYRRGMYTFFWRATPHPSLMVFDAPDSTSACTRRIRSNTPLQSLTLLNDDAFFDLARRLAEKLDQFPADSAKEKIDKVFRDCLGRNPKLEEASSLLAFYKEELASFKEAPAEAARLFPGKPAGEAEQSASWLSVARVMLNLDEFITRE